MANALGLGVDIRKAGVAMRSFLPQSDVRKEVLARTTCVVRVSTNADIFYSFERVDRKSLKLSQDSKAVLLERLDDLKAHLRPKDRVLLIFEDSATFIHDLRVPMAAQSDIRRIVNARLMQLMPGSLDKVFHCYWMLKSESGEVLVRNAVFRKSVVVSVSKSIEQIRAAVIAVGVQGNESEFAPAFLTKTGVDYQTAREAKWMKAALFAAMIFGVSAVVSATILSVSLSAQERDIAQRLPDAQSRAQEIRQALDVQERMQISFRDLSEAKRKSLRLLGVWSTVSQKLPKSAWLQKLALDKDAGYMEGVAEDAETLLKLLDASDLFEGVAFAAPVTQVQNSKRQRFALKFNFKP